MIAPTTERGLISACSMGQLNHKTQSARHRDPVVGSTLNRETRDRGNSAGHRLWLRRVETGEMASAPGVGVIGTKGVLQLFRSGAASGASLVPFAFGIESAG